MVGIGSQLLLTADDPRVPELVACDDVDDVSQYLLKSLKARSHQ
jgi:hypothetical protein